MRVHTHTLTRTHAWIEQRAHARTQHRLAADKGAQHARRASSSTRARCFQTRARTKRRHSGDRRGLARGGLGTINALSRARSPADKPCHRQRLYVYIRGAPHRRVLASHRVAAAAADFELVRSFGAALLEGAALEAAVRGVVEQGEGRGECGVAAGD